MCPIFDEHVSCGGGEGEGTGTVVGTMETVEVLPVSVKERQEQALEIRASGYWET